MARRHSQLSLPPMPLQSVSSSDADREAEWQAIPAKALMRSGISQKAAAIAMGKSESWVSRALRGLEKLGWGDLGALEDPVFWREVFALAAEFWQLARTPETPAAEVRDLAQAVRELRDVLKAHGR